MPDYIYHYCAVVSKVQSYVNLIGQLGKLTIIAKNLQSTKDSIMGLPVGTCVLRLSIEEGQQDQNIHEL